MYVFFVIHLGPPDLPRTASLFPSTTLFRSRARLLGPRLGPAGPAAGHRHRQHRPQPAQSSENGSAAPRRPPGRDRLQGPAQLPGRPRQPPRVSPEDRAHSPDPRSPRRTRPSVAGRSALRPPLNRPPPRPFASAGRPAGPPPTPPAH